MIIKHIEIDYLGHGDLIAWSDKVTENKGGEIKSLF